jgi:hypothetical protein
MAISNLKLPADLTKFYNGLDLDSINLKEINNWYLQLPRSFENRDELTKIKFALQKFRQDYLTRLLQLKSKDLYEKLQTLNIYFFPDQLRAIEHLITPEQVKAIKKYQGEDFPKLKVKPFKHSAIKFKDWSFQKEFFDYSFCPRGVLYRGLEFISGDLLMVSPALESGGLFTVFSEPDSFSAHLAIFVMLDKQGTYLPSVLEIHEHGVRALPLCHYLSPEFSTYVEVIRDPQMEKAPLEKISEISFRLIDECQGYSFQTDDRDHKHFTCTRLATELRQRLGLPKVEAKSTFTIQSYRRNLDHLEFKFKTILEPNDFLVTEGFEFVGVVDNQLLHFEVLSRISINAYLKLFASESLSLNKLGLLMKLFLFCTENIQQKNRLGKILATVFGYSLENFPQGSKELLSYFYFTDKKITKLAKKLNKKVYHLLRRPYFFDLEEFEASAEMQALLKEEASCLKNLF